MLLFQVVYYTHICTVFETLKFCRFISFNGNTFLRFFVFFITLTLTTLKTFLKSVFLTQFNILLLIDGIIKCNVFNMILLILINLDSRL